MRRPILLVAAGLAAAAVTGTAGPSIASAAPAATTVASTHSAPAVAHTHGQKRVCGAKARAASCKAEVLTKDGNVTPDATTSYSSGYSPQQLQKAYAVPSGGAGTTIAIVDAYANPNAQADLNTYRSRFGLPATTLRQYRQNGSAISTLNTPGADVGWGKEESLDLDMASAICPKCSIVYVGANSAAFGDLSVAVQTAYAKGASVISNSYGGDEFSGENSTTNRKPFDYPDALVTIASGDDGYGPQFPAALSGRNILAVGGTNLTLNANGTRKTETVWSGAGSGCSGYVPKPSWQKDAGCARRTIADVSAVAAPVHGVAVYDSFGSVAGANWYVFGGTSVAAPVVGAYYAASGIGPKGVAKSVVPNLYANRGRLFDVTRGTNGPCAGSAAYLCNGRVGYDGPSGLGSLKQALSR